MCLVSLMVIEVLNDDLLSLLNVEFRTTFQEEWTLMIIRDQYWNQFGDHGCLLLENPYFDVIPKELRHH